VQGYGVYRDGSLLQGLGGEQSGFTDDDITPGNTYTYEIRARVVGAVSEPVSIDVEVRVPPLKAARVLGDFAVTTHLIRKSGYSTWKRPTFGWHFTPRCDTGPCAVDWRDIGLRRVHAKLRRKGAKYEGHYSGPFLVKCNGRTSTSSVTLSLKVAKARSLRGEWRATKLVGTLTNSEAPELGCGGSSAELRVTARMRAAG
jgi:hypothetical protein